MLNLGEVVYLKKIFFFKFLPQIKPAIYCSLNMMLLEVAQSSWLDQDRSHSLEMSKLAEEQNRHVKAEKWPWSDLSEITNCMANWSNRQKFEVRLLSDAFLKLQAFFS